MELLSEPTTKADRSVIRSFYQNHFDRYRSMSITKTRYAREHKIVLHRFVYWSLKFERTLGEKKASADKSSFIPIKIRKEPSVDTPPILCTLELGKGKRLLIHHSSALSPLLELLGG